MKAKKAIPSADSDFGQTCCWSDRERGSSLAEDWAPCKLSRVIKWVLQGHHTSDSCLGWQTQGR